MSMNSAVITPKNKSYGSTMWYLKCPLQKNPNKQSNHFFIELLAPSETGQCTKTAVFMIFQCSFNELLGLCHISKLTTLLPNIGQILDLIVQFQENGIVIRTFWPEHLGKSNIELPVFSRGLTLTTYFSHQNKFARFQSWSLSNPPTLQGYVDSF